jgi:hypothetical protein
MDNIDKVMAIYFGGMMLVVIVGIIMVGLVEIFG